MSTLVNFLRTTGFRLALIYFVVFSIAAGLCFYYILASVQSELRDRVIVMLDAEIQSLSRIYRQGGIADILRVVERRSRAPGANLYLVIARDGTRLAGNIQALSPSFRLPEGGTLTQISYRRGDEPGLHEALIRAFRLTDGYRVVVGRDLAEQSYFRSVLAQILQFWLVVAVVLSIVTWIFVNRRVVRRIDSIALTARRIMDGNLSDRLPVTGRGDEFDRLSGGLNAMLTRMERLVHGLREVSDNIAHDLKTPLTRMRNRLELALPGLENLDAPESAQDVRRASQKLVAETIEESDKMIGIFDALLRIARVEAKAGSDETSPASLRVLAAEIVELYAPLAEDRGADIILRPGADITIPVNRQLVAQALSNLLENALKYAIAPGHTLIEVSLGAVPGKEPCAELCVADQGAGIGEEDRARVLQRFVRLAPARSSPGSGLGLSLVRAVAHMHNGDLILEDNVPHGLVARIRLRAPLSAR